MIKEDFDMEALGLLNGPLAPCFPSSQTHGLMLRVSRGTGL